MNPIGFSFFQMLIGIQGLNVTRWNCQQLLLHFQIHVKCLLQVDKEYYNLVLLSRDIRVLSQLEVNLLN
jgi:hypothetical protein